jgi:hypothetical protein
VVVIRERLVAFVFAAAMSIAPTARAEQGTTPVVFDADLTVGAGASIAAVAGEAVARAEESFVPARLFAERGVAPRTANVAYRVAKIALFDLPQEQWFMVVNHEVFGHGGRLRELFDGPIGYSIDAPAPYGSGGGSTSFTFDREPSLHELLAVSAGGMEADGVAASLLTDRAFSEARLRPRDAMRYLGFELDVLTYVWSTDDEPEEPGHDVSDFLQTYNELAQRVGAPPTDARALRREALAGLANPMLAYAAYSIGRYLWSGAADVRVPTLSIAGVRYLPLVRYRLTPYGTEWALVNQLGGPLRSAEVVLRVGRSPLTTPWGIGVRQRELARWRSWRLDVGIDVWRQPDLASGDESTVSARMGSEVSARAERPIVPVWFSSSQASVIVDVGVKSRGFVPGEPLRGGFVFRAGVGLPLVP